MNDVSKKYEGDQPDITKQNKKTNNKPAKEKPQQQDNRNPEPAVSGSALERLIKTVAAAVSGGGDD